jgi:hypothetical protein
MSTPASRKSMASKLFPIVGAFLFFSFVASYNHNVAMALAIGAIVYAAISMLVAITRKH